MKEHTKKQVYLLHFNEESKKELNFNSKLLLKK